MKQQQIRTCNNLMELIRLARTNHTRICYIKSLERCLVNAVQAKKKAALAEATQQKPYHSQYITSGAETGGIILRTTGIVRHIDTLGRIVIPKETRRMLRIDDGDPMEISVSGSEIILRKYQPIDSCKICGERCSNMLSTFQVCLTCAKQILDHRDLILKYMAKGE